MRKYRVGLGVCGGIAAYKAVEVLRLLQKAGCEVRVAMTAHATEFVTPLTFRSLTDSYVLVDDYDSQNPDPIAHINFSQEIDLFLIVPATANIIGKFANGIADDFLSTTYLASNAPVLVAPAMNTSMWFHPATQRNIEKLRSDGVRFVEPIEGELACKTVGTGKLEDVENIVSQAMDLLEEEKGRRGDGEKRRRGEEETGRRGDGETGRRGDGETGRRGEEETGGKEERDLSGERLLITVGGTREAIDPVRYISNHSSGKMGFAVAEAARTRGADVTVVAGATSVDPPADVRVVRVTSAREMHAAVMENLAGTTVFIAAAAVADYAPAQAAATKIKKNGQDMLNLELTKTRDILADVAGNRQNGLIVAGFAAETNDVINYARSKMEKKGLDLVVANDITKDGAGFNTDTNIATILTQNGGQIDVPLMSKRELADKILDEIVKLRKDTVHRIN
jgi:phosphopantothenoylcysteine decarboxylase/phosphopantothenate--cysteine ligase